MFVDGVTHIYVCRLCVSVSWHIFVDDVTHVYVCWLRVSVSWHIFVYHVTHLYVCHLCVSVTWRIFMDDVTHIYVCRLRVSVSWHIFVYGVTYLVHDDSGRLGIYVGFKIKGLGLGVFVCVWRDSCICIMTLLVSRGVKIINLYV